MFVIVPLFIALVWGYLLFQIIGGIVSACRGKKSKCPLRHSSVGTNCHNDHLHRMMHEDAMRAHNQAHDDAVRMSHIAHNDAMHAHDMGMHMHETAHFDNMHMHDMGMQMHDMGMHMHNMF